VGIQGCWQRMRGGGIFVDYLALRGSFEWTSKEESPGFCTGARFQRLAPPLDVFRTLAARNQIFSNP
jgi:hypothetical protein